MYGETGQKNGIMLTPIQGFPPRDPPLPTAWNAAQYNYVKNSFCDFGFLSWLPLYIKKHTTQVMIALREETVSAKYKKPVTG